MESPAMRSSHGKSSMHETPRGLFSKRTVRSKISSSFDSTILSQEHLIGSDTDTSFRSQSSGDNVSYKDIPIDTAIEIQNDSQNAKLRYLEPDPGELLNEQPEKFVRSDFQDSVINRSDMVDELKQRPSFYDLEHGQEVLHFHSTIPSHSKVASLMIETKEKDRQFSKSEDYCCLHCRPETCRPFQRFKEGICCNNGRCNGCNHSCCLDPVAVATGYHSAFKSPSCCHNTHNVEKLHQREKTEIHKCHLRPVSGGMNFILCSKCLNVLQIPQNFHMSKIKSKKLRCSFCSMVILYSHRDETGL